MLATQHAMITRIAVRNQRVLHLVEAHRGSLIPYTVARGVYHATKGSVNLY